MSDKIDNIYRQTSQQEGSPLSPTGSFRFDARVADVFNDMISRSVPGYSQILNMLPTLTKQLKQPSSNYYDLGCSLGAGMLAMAQGFETEELTDTNIIGIDNSTAMLNQARNKLSAFKDVPFKLKEQDIQSSDIDNAAIVLMNFTLQFIPLNDRMSMINKIFHGLHDGGALILSEKIKFKESSTHDLLTDIHHQYKADQGYSQLEIAQKRDAIENVLIPETLDAHTQRLKGAGFRIITPWVQNLQFISILAIK